MTILETLFGLVTSIRDRITGAAKREQEAKHEKNKADAEADVTAAEEAAKKKAP